MKNASLLFILLLFLHPCDAQTATDSIGRSNTIVAQAEAMAQFLLNKEFKSFTLFSYPKLVEMMGGEQKMVDVLEKGSKEMEEQGVRFLRMTVGKPSKILLNRDELQCTLPQKIEMKVPEGRLVSLSTLIAISSDQGKHWHFIDTAGKDIHAMIKILPNLSSDLVIPTMQKPTFYKD